MSASLDFDESSRGPLRRSARLCGDREQKASSYREVDSDSEYLSSFENSSKDDDGFDIPRTVKAGNKSGTRVTSTGKKRKQDEPAVHLLKIQESRGPAPGKLPTVQNSELMAAVRSRKSARVTSILVDWVETFTSDRFEGLVILLNFMLEAAGFPRDTLSRSDVDEKPMADIADEVVATLDSRGLTAARSGERYPLYTRDRSFKDFTEQYRDFWQRLTSEADRGMLETSTFLEDVKLWIGHFTMSKIRCIRHSAVVAACGVCSGLVRGIKALKDERKIFQQQRGAEKDPATLSEIDSELRSCETLLEVVEAAIDQMFREVCATRWKDIFSEIRFEIVIALCDWAEVLPAKFLLTNSFTKLLKWMMFDKYAVVRLQVLKFLERSMQDPEASILLLGPPEGESTGNAGTSTPPPFMEIFISRLAECVHDTDPTVGITALRCLTCLHDSDLLTEDVVGMVVDMLFYEKNLQRVDVIVEFIDAAVFKRKVIHDSGENVDPSELSLELKCLVDFLVEFTSDYPKLAYKIVHAFWSRAPVLRAFELMMDQLMVGEQFAQQICIGNQHRFFMLQILLVSMKLARQDLLHETHIDDDMLARMESAATAVDPQREVMRLVIDVPSLSSIPMIVDGKDEVYLASFVDATITAIRTLPKLFTLCQAESEELVLVCHLAELTISLIPFMVSTASGSSFDEDFYSGCDHCLTIMGGYMTTHVNVEVLDSAAGALSVLEESTRDAEPDSRLGALHERCERVIMDLMSTLRTRFTDAYMVLNNSTNVKHRTAMIEDLHYAVVRLAAITKSGVCNPFHGHWQLLDYLVELCEVNGQLRDVIETDAAQDEAAALVHLLPEDLIVAVQETMVCAYHHTWCDIYEGYANIMSALNKLPTPAEDMISSPAPVVPSSNDQSVGTTGRKRGRHDNLPGERSIAAKNIDYLISPVKDKRRRNTRGKPRYSETSEFPVATDPPPESKELVGEEMQQILKEANRVFHLIAILWELRNCFLNHLFLCIGHATETSRVKFLAAITIMNIASSEHAVVFILKALEAESLLPPFSSRTLLGGESGEQMKQLEQRLRTHISRLKHKFELDVEKKEILANYVRHLVVEALHDVENEDVSAFIKQFVDSHDIRSPTLPTMIDPHYTATFAWLTAADDRSEPTPDGSSCVPAEIQKLRQAVIILKSISECPDSSIWCSSVGAFLLSTVDGSIAGLQEIGRKAISCLQNSICLAADSISGKDEPLIWQVLAKTLPILWLEDEERCHHVAMVLHQMLYRPLFLTNPDNTIALVSCMIVKVLENEDVCAAYMADVAIPLLLSANSRVHVYTPGRLIPEEKEPEMVAACKAAISAWVPQNLNREESQTLKKKCIRLLHMIVSTELIRPSVPPIVTSGSL